MNGRDPPTPPDQLELFLAEEDDGSFEWFMHHGPTLAETPQTKGPPDRDNHYSRQPTHDRCSETRPAPRGNR